MFLLFAGSTYYPAGGWSDYRGRYDSLEAATEAAANLSGVDWWQVVEAAANRIVRDGVRSY